MQIYWRDMSRSALTTMKTLCLLVLVLIHGSAAGAADAAPGTAVIFMYHHFGEPAHPSTNIRLEQFDAQLEYLQRAGYQILPLEDIVASLQGGPPLPPRAVAITIDDAYLSVYREAFPRLRARGWPFTVFVATDPVDQGLRAFMNWGQMREMQAHGATFANHSRAHDYLIRRRPDESPAQWQERIRADLGHAQRRLEEELGRAPKLFAYPYGEYDTALASLVREMGFVAFGQQSGAVGRWSDLRALPRYPMAEAFADLAQFRVKAASLPLPVLEVVPWDPVTTAPRPRMALRLEESDARLSQLACYASGQGALPIQWLNRNERRFSVQARQDLPPGRSRYNCTAPSGQAGRFYWFSHLWIRPSPPAAPPAALQRAASDPPR